MYNSNGTKHCDMGQKFGPLKLRYERCSKGFFRKSNSIFPITKTK